MRGTSLCLAVLLLGGAVLAGCESKSDEDREKTRPRNVTPGSAGASPGSQLGGAAAETDGAPPAPPR